MRPEFERFFETQRRKLLNEARGFDYVDWLDAHPEYPWAATMGPAIGPGGRSRYPFGGWYSEAFDELSRLTGDMRDRGVQVPRIEQDEVEEALRDMAMGLYWDEIGKVTPQQIEEYRSSIEEGYKGLRDTLDRILKGGRKVKKGFTVQKGGPLRKGGKKVTAQGISLDEAKTIKEGDVVTFEKASVLVGNYWIHGVSGTARITTTTYSPVGEPKVPGPAYLFTGDVLSSDNPEVRIPGSSLSAYHHYIVRAGFTAGKEGPLRKGQAVGEIELAGKKQESQVDLSYDMEDTLEDAIQHIIQVTLDELAGEVLPFRGYQTVKKYLEYRPPEWQPKLMEVWKYTYEHGAPPPETPASSSFIPKRDRLIQPGG